jgi:hypothetical protein
MAGLRTSQSVNLHLMTLQLLQKNKKEMAEKEQEVFNWLRGAKMRIHPQKSRWFVEKVKYLDHIFGPNGVAVDPMKTKIVEEYPRSTTQKS